MSLPEQFMSQKISPWDGELWTRRGLLAALKQEGRSDQFIDFWVFRSPELLDSQIEPLVNRGYLKSKEVIA